MAGEEREHYSDDKTPFAAPHELGKTPSLVSAKTYDKAYTPKKTITVGQAAAAVFGAGKYAGIIAKIGKKKKRAKTNYVWFEDMPEPVLASHCVGLPAPNEFVRHEHSGRWFKVGDVLAPTVSLFPVFKKTANKLTVGKIPTNKTAVAAKSAADKTDNAAAKNAADKTDKASDKTDNAAAKNAADKTATPAQGTPKTQVGGRTIYTIVWLCLVYNDYRSYTNHSYIIVRR